MITILTISSLYQVQKISGIVSLWFNWWDVTMDLARFRQVRMHHLHSLVSNLLNNNSLLILNFQIPMLGSAVGCCCSAASSTFSCQPIPNLIQIIPGVFNPSSRFFYCPQGTVVKTNTYLSWINSDSVIHTVTFLNEDRTKVSGEYDSGFIYPGPNGRTSIFPSRYI